MESARARRGRTTPAYRARLLSVELWPESPQGASCYRPVVSLGELHRRRIEIPSWLRSLRNWFIGLLVTLTGLMAWSIPAWVDHEQTITRRAREAELDLLLAHASKHRERVERIWKTEFYLRDSDAGVDAASFLNPRLRWERGMDDFVAKQRQSHSFSELLEASRPVADHGAQLSFALNQVEVKAFLQRWDAGVPEVLYEIDTSRLDELARFSRWNLYDASPALETREFPGVRLPFFSDLDRLVTAELHQALRSGTVGRASQRVRQAAWLALTTQDDTGVRTALDMLEREERLLGREPTYEKLGAATADEVAAVVAYERSLALVCAEGCASLTRLRLPPQLECAVETFRLRTQSLQRWSTGQDLPSLSEVPCHVEDIVNLHSVLLRQPAGVARLPSVRIENLELTLPSRLGLGDLLVHLLLPEVALRYRHADVSPPSAQPALERLGH